MFSCECRPFPEQNTKTLKLFNFGISRPYSLSDFAIEKILGEEVAARGPYAKWSKMIEELTGRDLNFASDALPAISGIASQFKQLIDDTYLSGIWQNDIARGLLWRVNYGDMSKHCRRTDRYCAPSWSWLLVTGHIDYGHRRDGWDWISDLEIVSAVCVASGRAPFGPVRNAYLDVIGLIAPSMAFGLPPEDSPQQVTSDIDWGIFSNVMKITLPDMSIPPASVSFYAVVRGDGFEISSKDSLFLLLAGHSNSVYYFLVLRRSKLKPTAYEGVGFGHFEYFDPCERRWLDIATKQRIVLI